MDSDSLLVWGMIVAAVAIPAIVSAFADSRPPRAGGVGLLVGLGLVAFAVISKPGGYPPGQIPEVFARVLANWLR